jgi:hypothetical protein
MSTPQPARPAFPVVLDPDEAVNLAHLLDILEDWLGHADTDAHDDLAHYLDDCGHGTLAARGLLATLGQTSLGLHQRIKEARR